MRHGNPMALLLAVAIGSPAAAQDVSGTWEVTWAAGVRVQRDGGVEVERWGEATLDLDQEGDRVTGIWTRPIEGQGSVRWTVEGTFRDGVVALRASEGAADGQVVRDQLAQVEGLEWEGRLTGDGLEGEMRVILRDAPRLSVPRPWRAQR
jgi:hypothetical protein